MNAKPFTELLNEVRKASEAFGRTGTAEAKERAKDSSPDARARDAARKRIERSKKIPHERQSKDQLIKEVIAVKTRNNKVQIIFKDSFNKELHTRVGDKELTMADANQILQDPKFEQTRASMLLFGDTKKKQKKEQEPKRGEREEGGGAKKREQAPEEEGEEKKAKPQKARKMSKEEMFDMMSQMSPEQIATLPPEIRQEYFKMTRKPIQNREFDHISDSYEELSVKFGINPSSSIPFNQQVLNAFMFLAKMKAGASEQEMQAYNAMSPGAMEFTQSAFAQAKKLLSQIGDECIQNLMSSIESNQTAIDSAGATDMQCGNYRFKISAGGEIALSTSTFDQSNKTFRGYLGQSLFAAMQKEFAEPSSEKMMEVVQELSSELAPFSENLIPQQALEAILSDEKLVKKLQNTPIKDDAGNIIGYVIDEGGNLNPLASLENYQKTVTKYSKKALSGGRDSIFQNTSIGLLKTVLRGDNIVDPLFAPNHVVTANGVFPLTDDYINEISKTSDLEYKPAKELISSSNIEKYKPAAVSMLKNYRAVIEQVEEQEEAKEEKPKQKSKKDSLFVPKEQLNPINILVSDLIDNYDFTFNSSLLPGFSPKDLNTVEYNYVRIGKKTVKIPVVNDENPTVSQMMGESHVIVNDVLIESMTNNFVLKNLLDVGLINEVEADVLSNGVVSLLESTESTEINLQQIYDNVMERVFEYPGDLLLFLENTYGILSEESKRDYKKEYRNYHGKAKQRKERAARTKARELMKKKGLVRKGDGVDIDHKKPLRSGGSKGINNLRRRKKSENRSDNGHKKGEKQSKDWK